MLRAINGDFHMNIMSKITTVINIFPELNSRAYYRNYITVLLGGGGLKGLTQNGKYFFVLTCVSTRLLLLVT
jgi:hypothetical protein